ncbi:MAG TPA: MFS transporter, partial [Patescibacteria group bacterium]|nr:MFS transporter [Patescibacteria group bacterium]
VLLVTDCARGVIMLGLAGLVAVDGPLWAIVALAVLATCFSCFFGPTIGAYLPTLVRDERELGPANSAWSTLDNLAFVIGPAVAAILIQLSGLTLAFVLNAISFAFVSIILWRLPHERRTGGEPASAGEDADAERKVGAIPRTAIAPLAGLALIDIVAGFVFGGLGVLTVIIVVKQLGLDEAATGFLSAAVGVGGILGAVASGAFVIRSGLRVPLLVGSIALAAGVAALGLTGSLGPALVAMAIASAGSLLTEVVSTTIFQRIVPDEVRGRALGAIATISTLAYAAGSLVLPVASGVVGTGPVLIASGGLVVIGAVVSIALIGAGADRGPSAELVSTATRVAGLPVFAGVPESRLVAAFSRATEQRVAAGTVVIHEGDPADRFFVILAGSFAVDQAGPAGRPTRLRSMGSDEVFGELGLLTGAPRSATVSATTDGRLLVLDAADFLDLVESGAEVGPRLLALHRGATNTG